MFWQDTHRTLYHGDCRTMVDLPDETVQLCVTSPPYWGLRKYAGLPDLIWGGKEGCQHEWQDNSYMRNNDQTAGPIQQSNRGSVGRDDPIKSAFCSLCGAWKGSVGLEPTPELYLDHLIQIFREVRRVLRKDGVVFLNIGDTYSATRWSGKGKGQAINKFKDGYRDINPQKNTNLPDKNLCLIPFRLAIALQEDGWWVRSVIIWNKPNPMPESVRDRPTESHEYILMITKSAKYYYDQEAVREPTPEYTSKFRHSGRYIEQGFAVDNSKHNGNTGEAHTLSGRNLRSVWSFPTQPYPEAHFATYPEELVRRCVLAATPEVGCCSQCGKAWARIVERGSLVPDEPQYKPRGNKRGDEFVKNAMTPAGETQGHPNFHYEKETLGWKPQCKCNADKVPSIVLDCFGGAGTTALVAAKLGRRSITYELSKQYCDLAVERNKQSILM